MNALRVAVLQEFPLRVLRVELDLVGSRDDLGNLKELLEVGNGEVGDTNGLGLAGGNKSLHSLVGLGDIDILKDDLALGILSDCLFSRLKGYRPVLCK